MAQNLRRLARLACEKPHALFTRRPISHGLNRLHFSVSESAFKGGSAIPEITPVLDHTQPYIHVICLLYMSQFPSFLSWSSKEANNALKVHSFGSNWNFFALLNSRLEDHQGFEKWHNGCGRFHSSACIDETAVIEFGAIVHPKAAIGPNTYIGSGAIIGPAVSIGQSTKLGYNVSLSNCTIGDYCIIHNGVCIGQDGFGFFLDERGDMVKKPQILKALIGHHVEIGANTCIDRGSWRDTTIGDHTKIDNLVQIGHNVVIGKYCMLCGQVGIAGSVTMGDYITLGGQVAVRDHVSIVSKLVVASVCLHTLKSLLHYCEDDLAN
ncbi:trimeric LpxA-like enzymes superfamily protein [Actinidia rufa]|uniref:Trimeric LpxA-like enzymes superfamily protein n=1 Tax=Actinidia rufa TaxID=165716 RepID=A0A7J0FXI3_9ERIC|nr:trimeric LpxA-like enzymes superfamily protein [Actinidia rufa]